MKAGPALNLYLDLKNKATLGFSMLPAFTICQPLTAISPAQRPGSGGG
jgi:hypothetical protein